MKKLIFISILSVVATFNSNAQKVVYISTGFSNWTSGVPDGWKGSKSNFGKDSANQISSGSVYGTSDLQLMNPSSTSHRRFTTQTFVPGLVKDGRYELTIWAKGKADVRFGLFEYDALKGFIYSPYKSVNGSSLQMITYFMYADTTVSNAQFILSVKATDPSQSYLIIDSLVITGPKLVNSIGESEFYNSNESAISVFPNPTSETINVELPQETTFSNLKLRILDLAGKEVFRTTSTQKITSLNIETIEAGMYTLQVTVDDRYVFNKSFIKH
jgi:hypothetical protein